MKVSFEEIGSVAATFLTQEGVAPGKAVTVAANGAVGLGENGSSLCGVTLAVEEDGCAVVQIAGLAPVVYAGTAPGLGYTPLAVDGQGRVTAAASGQSYLVVSVDTDAQTAFIKL